MYQLMSSDHHVGIGSVILFQNLITFLLWQPFFLRNVSTYHFCGIFDNLSGSLFFVAMCWRISGRPSPLKFVDNFRIFFSLNHKVI